MNRKFVKFETLCESISNELISLEEYEMKPEISVVSLEEFKHFCKNIGILTELGEVSEGAKVCDCKLFLADKFDESKNPIRFYYWNKQDKQYVKEYPKIFEALNDYKQFHTVTLDGTYKTPIIIWG